MIWCETEHPPGAVAFVGQESARFHSFTICFTGLNVPAGTRAFTGIGYSAAYNRNAVISSAFDNCETCHHPHRWDAGQCTAPDCKCDTWVDQGLQWIQIWDDDHTFHPSTLLSLLEKHVDLVVPLYAQRTPPFKPCVYKSRDEQGWQIHKWEDFEGQTGLFKIEAAGAGGVLIRRRVVDALRDPQKPKLANWFEHEGGIIGEDMSFFAKCLAKGFQPYVALDIPLGHTTPAEVWPNANAKGHWGTKVILNGNPAQVVEFWSEQYRQSAV